MAEKWSSHIQYKLKNNLKIYLKGTVPLIKNFEAMKTYNPI